MPAAQRAQPPHLGQELPKLVQFLLQRRVVLLLGSLLQAGVKGPAVVRLCHPQLLELPYCIA